MSVVCLVTNGFQPLPGSLRDPLQPVRIELVAAVVLQEVLARHLAALGHAQQLAFQRRQPLVELLELGDQLLDAVVVQPHLLDLAAPAPRAGLLVGLLRARGDLLAARSSSPAGGAASCAASCRGPRSPRRSPAPRASASPRARTATCPGLRRPRRHRRRPGRHRSGSSAGRRCRRGRVGGDAAVRRRRTGALRRLQVDDVAQQHPAGLELRRARR